ncbi:MAG: DUF982 domain-containing protein [Thaumarchaeota archaeon]|nr:DUF982 domain-containing protein [Nitrososphaerota archaeon]MBI3023818.1 DUF982 domain-containing protein [Nitrososphaerota archaeon]
MGPWTIKEGKARRKSIRACRRATQGRLPRATAERQGR